MYIPTTQLSQGGLWNTYTPSWTSTGTQPAVVDGTLLGNYTQIGGLIVAKVSLTIGASTTFGTGSYSMSLPVAEDSTVGFSAGPGIAFDSNPGVVYIVHWRAAALLSNASPIATLSPSVPFTWASGDQLQLTITYKTT
jgi:hypothetical protein